MTVEDWRRTTLVRLDVLAETYGDLLEDADPNVRLRPLKAWRVWSATGLNS